MTDKTLNGQQIQAIQSQTQASLAQVIKSMEMRKAALQAAMQCSDKNGDLIELATRIYDFLTAPAADVKVTIE